MVAHNLDTSMFQQVFSCDIMDTTNIVIYDLAKNTKWATK